MFKYILLHTWSIVENTRVRRFKQKTKLNYDSKNTRSGNNNNSNNNNNNNNNNDNNNNNMMLAWPENERVASDEFFTDQKISKIDPNIMA